MTRLDREELLPTPAERRVAGRALATLKAHLFAILADRDNALPLCRELLARAPEDRLAAIVSDPTFTSPGLAHRLLDRAEAVCATDPKEADHLAAVAWVIGQRLLPPWTSLEREALLGRSRCVEGEAQRMRGDLAAAGAAQRQAFRHFEVLPVTSAERADFCRALARLRRDQGRDDEALALMARAIERYDGLPDLRRASECRLELAWMLLDQMETPLALELFEAVRSGDGVPLGAACDDEDAAGVEGSEESDFVRWLSLRHGLALGYAELRRDAEARAELDEIAGAVVGRSRLAQLRAKLVEAAVAQRLDANDEAEVRLAEAWAGLMEEGAPFEALPALLDLVQLYAERGKPLAIDGLKNRLLTLAGLPEPLREAWSLALEFAAVHGIAASEMLEALKLYLRRARHNPEARLSVLLAGAQPTSSDEEATGAAVH